MRQLANDALRHRVSGVTAVVLGRLADIAPVRAQRVVGAPAMAISRPSAATPTPIGTALVAGDALALRRVSRAEELCSPLGAAHVAVERARANAAWWAGLSVGQQRAVIATYPREIGNAEGVSPTDRDTANRLVLQELRDCADQIQSRLDEFGRLRRAERKFLERVNRLDLALQKASADATRKGIEGPLLLVFEPRAFGGDGRVVLSFGADPYRAESVSWHVPGVRTTMHSLFGFHTRCALHHLQSTMQEDPEVSAASIAWIGYDTPRGWRIRHAAGHRLAREGGQLLFADICAFNTARNIWAADGSHFVGNHVFGYSYGSTVACYAGWRGRLAGQLRTITLIGSPGAGPLRSAGDFGIAAGNVFVASSSRDVVASLGGRVPGSAGWLFGHGLGVDPAMESFGAVRISAEFPEAMNRVYAGGTHHAYYLHDQTNVAVVRSESLSNLGRIAAGRADGVRLDQHRSAGGRRTEGPARRRRWRDDDGECWWRVIKRKKALGPCK